MPDRTTQQAPAVTSQDVLGMRRAAGDSEQGLRAVPDTRVPHFLSRVTPGPSRRLSLESRSSYFSAGGDAPGLSQLGRLHTSALPSEKRGDGRSPSQGLWGPTVLRRRTQRPCLSPRKREPKRWVGQAFFVVRVSNPRTDSLQRARRSGDAEDAKTQRSLLFQPLRVQKPRWRRPETGGPTCRGCWLAAADGLGRGAPA